VLIRWDSKSPNTSLVAETSASLICCRDSVLVPNTYVLLLIKVTKLWSHSYEGKVHLGVGKLSLYHILGCRFRL
jgi:hypothetical protein